MNGLADARLHRLWWHCRPRVNSYSPWMFLLSIRQINCSAQWRTQIGVLRISHHSHDGYLEFEFVSRSLCKLVSNGVLRSAEEALCKRQVHNRDAWLPHSIRRRELSSRQNRLVQCSEIAWRDSR